jgi:thymidylate synthase
VKKAIETFKQDPTRRSVVMHTWIPMRDLEKFTMERKATSSPCLVMIHPQITEGKLHFFVVMKTNDLFNAWPGNAFAFSSLQEYMAKEIGVPIGTYNHFSVSMQVYEDMYDQARKL